MRVFFAYNKDMQTPNLFLSDQRHINIVFKKNKQSPFFLLPALFFIKKHDVTVQIEGFSVGVVFAHWFLQINIRSYSMPPTKGHSIKIISQRILTACKKNGMSHVTPEFISSFLETNPWAMEIFQHPKAILHSYTMNLLSDALKEHQLKSQKDTNLLDNFEKNIQAQDIGLG